MSFEVRPAQAGDLEAISRNAAENEVRAIVMSGADLGPIISNPYTRIVTLNGEPVAAGGFIDHGNGNALGWALIGAVPANGIVRLARTYRANMLATPFNWIEAHCNFTAAARWARLLGFKPMNQTVILQGKPYDRLVFRR